MKCKLCMLYGLLELLFILKKNDLNCVEYNTFSCQTFLRLLVNRLHKNGKFELQNCLTLLKKSFKYNTIFFVLINCSKRFCQYIRMKNPKYKIACTEALKNYLNWFKYNIF